MTTREWDRLCTPVTASGASEAVVRQLGDLMGSGILRAGDRLPPETELATLFRVAPMTVRSGLKVLRDHGLLTTRRGRYAGTFVAEDVVERIIGNRDGFPTLEEFTDFTVWREAITGEACARAATQITQTQMRELTELVAATQNERVGTPEFRFCDSRVYLFIAEVSGSRRILDEEGRIQADLTRTLLGLNRFRARVEFVERAHDPLLASILAGDADGARAAFSRHARATLDLLTGLGYLMPGEGAD
ncbi:MULTISPECIES: FCD domain-containing protein [unclassified Rhodococcus (in: high G+C Gram-positive bacteria)]|uniref:FadR/GntR family transcriptional regulator n=1 Tax=Rhodococcus sp. SJ-3 TaxID=3454628 RepID=UPI003F79E10D